MKRCEIKNLEAALRHIDEAIAAAGFRHNEEEVQAQLERAKELISLVVA